MAQQFFFVKFKNASQNISANFFVSGVVEFWAFYTPSPLSRIFEKRTSAQVFRQFD
jgi:hypothetical protein